MSTSLENRSVRWGSTVCGLLLAALCVSGCGTAPDLVIDRIVQDPHASGDDQCGLYGENLAKAFRVVVESAPVQGLLGGKGSRKTMAGAVVTFRVDEAKSGAVFAANNATTLTVKTDAAGTALAMLKLGGRPGDVDVSASVETPKGASTVAFRAVCGAVRIGANLEGSTGGRIPEFGLRLENPSGDPAVGVAVHFTVEGEGKKASVGGDQSVTVWTDDTGTAVTSWTLGSKIQRYFVAAEILDRQRDVAEDQRFHGRALRFEAMAINKRRMLVDLGGGLAIFILGMTWMSGGLRRMADRRLKAILQAMTRNRFMAAGVGVGLTAVIQSSSATTVMVVGFVNAGLLSLTQAIGVIYGAGIGTTITAQIIAFNLNSLALPAIGLGLIITTFSKRAGVKAFGESVSGFGLLFLGLTLMSGVLKPLQFSPTFQSYFQMFDCTPLAGGGVQAGPALMCILVGTITTMIVQSSSATVGLVLVLASQGLLSFYSAVPLVLGDNIGTTITAILASLGTNRNAKRAALANSLFKIFGAVYMYVLLFVPLWNGQPVFLGLIDYITPGDVFAASPQNLARHIANAHTVFNVFNVAVFLPFVGTMAYLCQRVIPLTDADQERVLEYLEPRLLASPSLALEQAIKEVAYMVRRAQKSINDGCTFFLDDGDKDLKKKIVAREELIDQLQHEITAYLVELSRKNLTPSEANLLPALVHAVNDAERIGDHSESFIELAYLRRDGKHVISQAAVADIRALQALLDEQFDATYRSLTEGDPEQVDRVLQKEEEINAFMRKAADNHYTRLESETCNVQTGVIILDVLGHFERVGDHLVNVAERAGRIIQVTKG